MTRAALLLVLAAAPPAAAHDYWLVPDTFTPKPGSAVAVRLFVGEAFKPEQEVGYQPKKTAVLQFITRTETLTEFPDLKADAKPAFAFTAPKTGTSILRVDRDWSTITMRADKFTAYLKEEGFDEAIRARAAAGETAADGRERYRRYLKTIVQTGDPDAATYRPHGQRLEIVTTGRATGMLGEVAVRVLFGPDPLVGAKVTAWHRDGDTLTTATATTDKNGKATLKLTKSGPWLVRTVHMRRVTDKNPDPPADWESFWAAVTFAVP